MFPPIASAPRAPASTISVGICASRRPFRRASDRVALRGPRVVLLRDAHAFGHHQALEQRRELRGGGGCFRARLQACHLAHPPVVVGLDEWLRVRTNARRQRGACGQRCVHVGPAPDLRAEESLRRDADNLGERAVHADRLADRVIGAAKLALPHAMADDDHRRAPHAIILREKRAPQARRDAERLEVVVAHVLQQPALRRTSVHRDAGLVRVGESNQRRKRLLLSRESPIHPRRDRCRLDVPGWLPIGGPAVPRGERVRPALARPADDHERSRIAHRQRPQQRRIHQSEDCAIRANPHRQRHDHRDRQNRRPPKLSHRVPHIRHQRFEPQCHSRPRLFPISNAA